MKEIKAFFFFLITGLFVLNVGSSRAAPLDSIGKNVESSCAFSTKGKEFLTEVEENLKEKSLEVSVAITFDMGKEAIESLAAEAKRFNAKLLIRGIPLTEKERETLLARGHFRETNFIQEENRAIIRRGFMSLAPYAKAGINLEIDPKFFKEHAVVAAPLILFQYGENCIRVRGVASILRAASLAANELTRKEEKPFLEALTRLEEKVKESLLRSAP